MLFNPETGVGSSHLSVVTARCAVTARVAVSMHRDCAAVARRGRRSEVCLKTISRRRGELHQPPFSEAFDKSGARITRPSDNFEMVSSAPSLPTWVLGFNFRLVLLAVVLIAGAACLLAGETSANNANLVIGLLVPPEEPGPPASATAQRLAWNGPINLPARKSASSSADAPANGARMASKLPGWSPTTARWA